MTECNVDITVPKYMDYVLAQTYERYKQIRDEDIRREEYQKAIKVEEFSDIEEEEQTLPGPSHSVHENDDRGDSREKDLDLISYVMKTMTLSDISDDEFQHVMLEKRESLLKKNETIPIEPNTLIHSAMKIANAEYQMERRSRSETHNKRESCYKYLPDDQKTQAVFDQSIIHNTKNPIVAAVYNGDVEEFFRHISNCSQSGLPLPDKTKCICYKSFLSGNDCALHLAISSHIHQLECDGLENCGRVSCRNGRNYMEIVERLLEGARRDKHLRAMVQAWFYPSNIYAQVCPLGYTLVQGSPETFKRLVDLLIKYEQNAPNFLMQMSRIKCVTDLIEEAIINSVHTKFNDLKLPWTDLIEIGSTSIARYSESGRFDALMIAMKHANKKIDRMVRSFCQATFDYDYPQYIEAILDSGFKGDICSIFDKACANGAENCVKYIMSNEHWMQRIYTYFNADCRRRPFLSLVKSSRMSSPLCVQQLISLVLKSNDFINFPFLCDVPELLFNMIGAGMWSHTTEWLKLLESRRGDKIRSEKAEEYLNILLRYLVYSSGINLRVLRVAVHAVVAAGGFLVTDANDYQLQRELVRKELLFLMSHTERPSRRFILDLEQEISKVTVSHSMTNPERQRVRSDILDPPSGAPNQKRSRLR